MQRRLIITPRFGIAGELYSQVFHDQLARVLKRKGKLFHYTGTPNQLTSGRDVPNEVAKSLRQAGFVASDEPGRTPRHRARHLQALIWQMAEEAVWERVFKVSGLQLAGTNGFRVAVRLKMAKRENAA